jgi:hypothetical protein
VEDVSVLISEESKKDNNDSGTDVLDDDVSLNPSLERDMGLKEKKA